jgi:hypothetical protein
MQNRRISVFQFSPCHTAQPVAYNLHHAPQHVHVPEAKQRTLALSAVGAARLSPPPYNRPTANAIDNRHLPETDSRPEQRQRRIALMNADGSFNDPEQRVSVIACPADRFAFVVFHLIHHLRKAHEIAIGQVREKNDSLQNEHAVEKRDGASLPAADGATAAWSAAALASAPSRSRVALPVVGDSKMFMEDTGPQWCPRILYKAFFICGTMYMSN